MSWLRYDQDYSMNIYKCDQCEEELPSCYPMVSFKDELKDTHYCFNCGFKLGHIDEVYYCDWVGGISSRMFAAGINPYTNEIELTRGTISIKRRKGKLIKTRKTRSKFSWEMNNQDLRKSKRYTEWRKNVFKRDNYTCQHCKKIGGNLEAHHIKSWAKYMNLRFDVDNGITLCKSCHKCEHKKLRGEENS